MPALERVGGKVEYVRLRGEKVRVGNKLCFAIERETNIPASLTSKDGFIFSEVGAGLYPVGIIADSYDAIKIAMRGSDATFYIDPRSKELGEPGFEICAKLTPMNEMKTLEIHDATSAIIKAVGGFVTGSIGGVVGSSISGGAELPNKVVQAVKEYVGIGMDVAGGRTDVVDSKRNPGKVGEAFASAGVRSGKVAAIIHIYTLEGFVRSGQKSIGMRDLAKLLF